jgi:hypothetical protein
VRISIEITRERTADERANPQAKEAKKQRRAEWAGRVVFAVAFLVGIAYLVYVGQSPPRLKSTSPNILDRAFPDAILDLFRIGLVLFGAYIVATIVQRVIDGAFEFKTAWGELPPRVAPIVTQATEPIRTDMEKATQDLQTAIEKVRSETDTKLQKLATDVIEPLTEAMVALQKKVGVT